MKEESTLERNFHFAYLLAIHENVPLEVRRAKPFFPKAVLNWANSVKELVCVSSSCVMCRAEKSGSVVCQGSRVSTSDPQNGCV